MQTRQYRLQIAASRPTSEVEPWAVTRMREFLPVIRATRKSNTAKTAWYALLRCFSSDFTFITGFGSHVSISSVPMRFSPGWFSVYCVRQSVIIRVEACSRYETDVTFDCGMVVLDKPPVVVSSNIETRALGQMTRTGHPKADQTTQQIQSSAAILIAQLQKRRDPNRWADGQWLQAVPALSCRTCKPVTLQTTTGWFTYAAVYALTLPMAQHTCRAWTALHEERLLGMAMPASADGACHAVRPAVTLPTRLW